MKKKVVKITAVVLLLIVGILAAIPFVLENKIGDIIKNKVNSSIHATFDFAKADLSLFRDFPNARLQLTDIVLINKAPFEGDTLFRSSEAVLSMSVWELFKDAGDPLQIKSLDLENALLNIQVDEEDRANYDITIDDSGKQNGGETPTENFTLDLQSYSLTNSRIIYHDKAAAIYLDVSNIDHKGSGDLSLSTSQLQTTTSALLSLQMDGTEYLKGHEVALDALIGIDLDTYTYTFLKNEGRINQLPLVFEGTVRVADDYQEVDIRFKTPSSDFKNFLALFPEAYSKDFSQVTTTGGFMVEGEFNGRIDDTHIPAFKVGITADKASFKYPDLPKAVEDIVLLAEVTNETGLMADTYLIVENASFKIDEDRFKSNARVTDFTGNTKVTAFIDANINLANISRAYPYAAEKDLKGQLKATISTAFDMASIEKKQYQNTRSSGQMSITDFEYTNAELQHPVNFQTIAVDFKPEKVTLSKMQGTMGKTDFGVSGTINNLLGFLFNKEVVEGNFTLNSNTFSVNDFMVAQGAPVAEETNPVGEEPTIRIPSFLDCTINATAQQVLYDNLVLKDVQGVLRIKDETATISNLTTSLFNGKLALNGEVSTKNETPTFSMKLGAEDFQLAEAFSELELFKVLAPVASALQGKLNSTIALEGLLGKDFTPDLATISGNVLAEIFDTSLKADRANVLNAMAAQLNFIKPEKLNLSGLKTALSFDNGVVTVKPFTVNYEDIAIAVTGNHSFDKKLNYKATLQVPAKYLGKDVNNMIAKIDDTSLQNLTIPVIASIGGLYSSPQVSTDLTSGVKNLTSQLIEIEKQKLLNKGKDKASDLIQGLLTGKGTATDSTATGSPAGNAVKETLGNLLKTTPQKKDSTTVKDSAAVTPRNDAVKEAAKSVLGGFLKKKKQDTATVKKDSVRQ